MTDYDGGNETDAFPSLGAGYDGGNQVPDGSDAIAARWVMASSPGNREASTPEVPACSNPPTAKDLSQWQNAYYWLSTDGAASLQIPGIGGGTAGFKRRVFVADAGRWKDCLADDQKTWVRYGVAIRLAIVVDYIKTDLKVGLAGLAAEAELSNVRTQSLLRISGYTGEDIDLPDWKEYDVDTYRELMAQASKIKGIILKNEAEIRPDPLGLASELIYGQDDPEADDATAVARVWALRQISEGRSCERAIRDFQADPASALGRRIAETYERLAGGCSGAEPSEAARDAAWQRLGRLA